MTTRRTRSLERLRGLERLEQRLPLTAATFAESNPLFEAESLTIPDEVVPLQSHTFHWRVNVDEDQTLPTTWIDKLYVSPDETLDATDMEVSSRQARSSYVRTDGEGQRYYELNSSVFWDFEDAHLFVVVHAAETPLDDANVAVLGVSIEIPKDHDAFLSDLNVSEVFIAGREVQYSLAVENLGAGSLNRPRVSFYLSDDAKHSTDDPLIGEVASGLRYVSGVWVTEGAFLPEIQRSWSL
ncbi:MAG: hypothetical protein AAFX06_24905 [Planctomycetota bacterium]